jgi:hypothetical protein
MIGGGGLLGAWVWLRFVEWRPCVVHSYLDHGAGDLFWQYRA